MNFFSEMSNEQFLSKIEQVLDRALFIYSENKNLQRLWSHLQFMSSILQNTNSTITPMLLANGAPVYVKAMEKSLDYILSILSFLQGIVNNSLVQEHQQDPIPDQLPEGALTRLRGHHPQEAPVDRGNAASVH